MKAIGWKVLNNTKNFKWRYVKGLYHNMCSKQAYELDSVGGYLKSRSLDCFIIYYWSIL